MPTYFHFTAREHLPLILSDGALAVTESQVGSPHPALAPYGDHLGPDVVWLVDSPDRPGAGSTPNHGLVGVDVDKSAIRFAVDVPALAWESWAPRTAMNPTWLEQLVRLSGGPEATRGWFVWPSAIRRSRWLEIVDLDSGESMPLG